MVLACGALGVNDAIGEGVEMRRPQLGLNSAYVLPCVLAVLVISALGFTAGQLVGSDPNSTASATSVSTYTYESTVKGKVIHLKGKVTKIKIPARTKVVHGRTITIPASTSVVTSPGQIIHTTRTVRTPGGVTTVFRTTTNTTTAVSTAFVTTTATSTVTTVQTAAGPTTTVVTTVTSPPTT